MTPPFEDQPRELAPDIASVTEFLADAGFTLNIEMKTVVTAQDIRTISQVIKKYNKFDLIVFDFDMGQSLDGSEIARILRSEVFTDMVFYSGKPAADLRKILYEKKIDGVFLVDRANFSDDLEPILEDYIRKICDVNNMRGVVMDEVSRFDRLLREKSKEMLTAGTDAIREKTKTEIAGRIKDRGEQMVKKADKITCPIEALSDHRLSDFNLVRQRLKGLLAAYQSAESTLSDSSLLSTMQNLRNRLAHLEAIYSEDGTMSLVDDQTEIFDFDRFRNIRLDLRKISSELEKLPRLSKADIPQV